MDGGESEAKIGVSVEFACPFDTPNTKIDFFSSPTVCAITQEIHKQNIKLFI
jgi:hypothetical protein